eukprot:maker-scaffold_3-snap-gene-15.25-mRNA-1 protein AED:0.18 eAED:0.18 QI:24/1/1/1/1/1/2/82/363
MSLVFHSADCRELVSRNYNAALPCDILPIMKMKYISSDPVRALSFIFTRENLASAISGSTSSVIALGLLYPLDRIRTLKQTETENKRRKKASSSLKLLCTLIQTRRFQELYKGIKLNLFALWFSNFIYFYFHTLLKSVFSSKHPSNLETITLTAVAGVINVFFTTPLWTAVTKLSMSTRNVSIRQQLRETYRTGGIKQLYAGLVSSLLLVSNPAIQFAFYERLKSIKKVKPTNSQHIFLLGATAKMIATLVTYPLQLSQTISRIKKNSKPRKYASSASSTSDFSDEEKEVTDDKEVLIQSGVLSEVKEILGEIYEKNGVQGLFRGMDVKLVQTCLTSAFMFTFYERLFSLIKLVLRIKTSKRK